MKVKLTTHEYEYLTKADFLPREIVDLILKNTSKPGLILDIDDIQAQTLRGFLSRRLLQVGYDSNDKLTEEGLVLDSLTDKIPRMISSEDLESYERRKQPVGNVFIVCVENAGKPSPIQVKTLQGTPYLAVASAGLVDAIALGKGLEGRLKALSIEDLQEAGQPLKSPVAIILLSVKSDVEMYLNYPAVFPYHSFLRTLST